MAFPSKRQQLDRALTDYLDRWRNGEDLPLDARAVARAIGCSRATMYTHGLASALADARAKGPVRSAAVISLERRLATAVERAELAEARYVQTLRYLVAIETELRHRHQVDLDAVYGQVSSISVDRDGATS